MPKNIDKDNFSVWSAFCGFTFMAVMDKARLWFTVKMQKTNVHT